MSARAAEAAARRDPRNAPGLIQAAEGLLRSAAPAEAARLAQLALALDPGSARTQRGASGILAAAGLLPEALAAAREAVRLRPDELALRHHLGALLLQAGHPREAAAELDQLVAAGGAAPAAWRQLSAALHRIAETERAVAAALEAVRLAPGELDHRLALASLLDAAGRYGDALPVLEEAARLFPESPRVWRAVSGVQEALGDLARAIDSAERAVALEPESPAFRAHLDYLRAPRAAALAPPPPPSPRVPRRPRVAPGFAAALAERRRVILALMLRDMRTRFGRSRLGYVWAVLEPIGHLATLGLVFHHLNMAPPPLGNDLFLYYITGLLPFLMFGHLAQELMHARGGGAAMMRLPVVGPLDLIAARAALQFATEIAVMIVILAAAGVLIGQGWPNDPLVAAAALLALGAFASGVGLCNCVLAEFQPAWETLFAAIVRLMYFASGIYYSPIAMPAPLREVLVWNPVLQGIEWFRAGFYGGYEPHWLAPDYLLGAALLALLLGLAAERAARPRLRMAT
jgi:capsular polysaccharide transport system permease protein